MTHDMAWAIICERHGWDPYYDEQAEHWDDMTDDEQRQLETTWNADYGVTGEPGWQRDFYW